jgi:drug efflux transport system permease protein
MNARRTQAMMVKECRHILRDPRSLAMALAVPLMLLLLFGIALSLDVDRVPTLVYDADRSPQSRELVRQFGGSRFFDIRGYTDSYAPIERGIDRGDILVGIAIQPYYGRRLAAGEHVDVQVLIDGSDSNTASIALSYVESLVRNYAFTLRRDALNLRGARVSPPVDPRMRVWYNSSLESRNYIVPGLIAVILMIIAALLTSLTIAREWEMGTMEQLLSTPLRPAEMVLGKMLAFFLVGVIDTAIAVLVGVFVFGVPLRGSVWFLALSSCIFLWGALFWGIFISAAVKSQLLAYQMGMLTSFLPAFLLSGLIYAIEYMPKPIQAFTYLVPARYFINLLKGIFLKGVGIEVLWLELLFLIAYAAIVFALATRKLSQKLA